MVNLTELGSVMPLELPGSALSPFLNKFTTSTLHLCGSYSFFQIQSHFVQHNHHGMYSFSPVLHGCRSKGIHIWCVPTTKIRSLLVCLCCFSILKVAYALLCFVPSEIFLQKSFWTTAFVSWCICVRLCSRIDFLLVLRQSFRWLWAFLDCGSALLVLDSYSSNYEQHFRSVLLTCRIYSRGRKGAIIVMHDRNLSDIRPRIPTKCRDGACRIFTDQADAKAGWGLILR